MKSKRIKFAHIAPTKHLEELTSRNGAHLILAHLVKSDKKYRDYYSDLKDGKPKILDNSAFEMFQQNKPMFDSSQLTDLAIEVSADYIVMSDYPNQKGELTIRAAKKLIDVFKIRGFKTFFVPQSRKGDLEDLIDTYCWAMDNQDVDLIGVSILGVPNAFGVLENKMQRFLSRWRFLRLLEERGIMHRDVDVNRFHFLGMLDGPNEISLVKDYHSCIHSWDSSSAVWLGLNGHIYDNSPTGLQNGKFDLEVDFDFSIEDFGLMNNVKQNVDYISRLIGDYRNF